MTEIGYTRGMGKKSDQQMEFEGQYDDEIVELTFRRHPVVMRKPFLFWYVLLALSIIPFLLTLKFSMLFVTLGAFLFGWLVFMYFWIGWYYSYFVVTDQRFIQFKQKGLFNTSVVEIALDKIQNVNMQIGGLQASLFKFGDIIVQTFVGDLVIDTVHHPERIHKDLSQIIRHHVRNQSVNLPDQLGE